MSLGDLGHQINTQGNNLYNQQRASMMREAEAVKARREAQEQDRTKQDIAHKQLMRQTVEGHILSLQQEILRAGRNNSNDPHFRGEIAMKERRLRELKNEQTHILGEIRGLQGRSGMAHNVHFNQPHYF